LDAARPERRYHQEERRSIVAEQLIGHGRKRSSVKDIILCVDQSGSTASSVVCSPIYDHRNAARFATLGIPVLAATPNRFADLIAAALSRHDMHVWAEQHGLKLERAESGQ
jgi:hypothetical protein